METVENQGSKEANGSTSVLAEAQVNLFSPLIFVGTNSSTKTIKNILRDISEPLEALILPSTSERFPGQYPILYLRRL